MKTKLVVVTAVAIAILLLWGGCQMVADDKAEKAPASTQGAKQVDSGVVKAPEQCKCAQKPIPKKKATRRTGKNRPLVHAKTKTATVQAPVAKASPPATPVAKKAVVTHGDDHMLDQVDTNWAKRTAAKPKEEPMVNVVREVVVIQQPAKFVHVIPSNYRTCQFLYGSYRCDNPGYNTYGTSYVQPYAPQPHQPVAVQRYVSAPAIRTAPTATPAIITAPQSIATR